MVTGELDFEALPDGKERFDGCHLKPEDAALAVTGYGPPPRTFCGYTIWDFIDNESVDNPRIQVLAAEEAVGDEHGLEVNLINLVYLALSVIAEQERLKVKSR